MFQFIEAVERSGLFDAEYYCARNPDLMISKGKALLHFYTEGYKDGRWPNPYFDPQWYLQQNPDVAEQNVQPLYHYAVQGESEGRRPSMFFDPAWYRTAYDTGGDLALAHYLKNRQEGTVSPIPEFDISYYAAKSPDVIEAKIDPFDHYIRQGYREGRDPSNDFNTLWYAKRYLNDDLSVNPFLHWLLNRHKPGVFGRMPDDLATVPREIRRFSRPAPEFEDRAPLPASAQRLAKVLAYYLPQFHAFDENDEWWGKGFTEWTNLPRGVPRFKGHYQPRVPRDLGFYSLDENASAAVFRRQVQMAAGAGIHGFVFYYYWFNGRRLMEKPLKQFLADASVDFPFALMWANENWTRRWDGADDEVLISQDYRAEDDEGIVADFARHFKDPRYIRFGGRPLLMIYRPGAIPDAFGKIALWRRLFQDGHGENPLLFMAQAFDDIDPHKFGMDGAVEFPPHKITRFMQPITNNLEILDPDFTGRAYDYDEIVKVSLAEDAPNFPLIKTAVPSWDNDARRQGAGLTITGSTPQKYENWLSALITRARERPVMGEAVVCVNAWNEWCEGAYLEPDIHFGSAYLNATGRAISGVAAAANIEHKLLLVGHDAFPSGAQHLLLNIARTLRRRHGMQVEVLLLDGGAMLDSYAAVAPTTVEVEERQIVARLRDYAKRGFSHALLNTAATGRIAPLLAAAGIDAGLLLIHELPRLLKEKGLVQSAQLGLHNVRNAAFAAAGVKAAVLELTGPSPASMHIMPQGSYKQLAPTAQAIAAFKKSLGIAESEALVLGAGYADMRKGFDLFLQVWRLANQDRDVHFCWIGLLAPELGSWIEADVAAAVQTGTFHMPGLLQDVAPAFGACDAFLLTSREDPFPTVTLEALSLGKPVFAFEGSGGAPEMLLETDAGVVLPYGDTTAMAAALKSLLRRGEPAEAADARRTLVAEKFGFAPYVGKLLQTACPDLARISVAVPNYNYARYLPERLGSIFRQTYPIHECIVLDDHSTDGSISVINQTAADWQRDIDLVANSVNSGSVFVQWQRAAERATGDWLWIAEADDSSEPEFLAKLIRIARSDPNTVLAFSDSRTIHADGSPQWESYKSYYSTVEPDALTTSAVYDGETFVDRFLSVKNLILNVSAVLWRRDALLATLDAHMDELRELRMAGDWQIYLRTLLRHGASIAYEAEPLNIHRRHEQSVTQALDQRKHLDEIRLSQMLARKSTARPNQHKTQQQDAYLDEVDIQLRVSKAPFKEVGMVHKLSKRRRS